MAEKKAPQKKIPFIGKLLKFVIFMLIVAAAIAATGVWWVKSPLPMSQPTLEVEVESGASARAVVDSIVGAGVQVNPDLLYQYFRWSGQSRLIRAGIYELNTADSPYAILQKLTLGSQVTRSIVLPEGWTFAQYRQRLNELPDIKHDTKDMTDAQVMVALGKSGQHPEGVFFPDTYVFDKGSSDLQVLRRSMKHMEVLLEQVWQERDNDLPIKTPYEALILASIIEKETGRDDERFMVAGVFTNRLRDDWLLQTDPTVVYGVGNAFTGRITQKNLDTDTPYNTYTRKGLPPTPIAMPSKKSLLAAVHPAKTKAHFFVARGDGTSHFSNTNADHDRAVAHYIRGKARVPNPSSGIIAP